MKINTSIIQGSLDWIAARAGIATASEFDQLVTPKWEVRKGRMPESYLHKKVAEVWLGSPLPGFNTLDMEYGQILEGEAIPWYEFTFSEPIQRVGLVTDDAELIGCSPDGLIGEDGGIEIKCPAAHTHTGYVLDGKLPDDYAAQVQGSLYVTGRKWWKFLSYRRKFPALILTIEPDPEAQEALAEALAAFAIKFAAAMERLTEKNGGPPERRKPSKILDFSPETRGDIYA